LIQMEQPTFLVKGLSCQRMTVEFRAERSRRLHRRVLTTISTVFARVIASALWMLIAEIDVLRVLEAVGHVPTYGLRLPTAMESP
jgi:hypothetical protein